MAEGKVGGHRDGPVGADGDAALPLARGLRGRAAAGAGIVGHGQAAALGGVFVVLADRSQAAVERLLFRLHDRDGHADVQEVHGDAAAHRAGADHGEQHQ